MKVWRTGPSWKPIAPIRSGGEPDPAASWDGADRGLERGSRDVVTLVHDDLAVGAQPVGEVAAELVKMGETRGS